MSGISFGQRSVFAVVIALFLAGCTSDPDPADAGSEGGATENATAPGADSGDALRIWHSAEFEPVFHPVQACCGQDNIHALIFNQLVSVEDDSQTIQPDLATDWDVSSDALEFTFTLADGITWHDGEPFSAGDVVWTANWTAANFDAFGTFAPAWSQIEGAEAVTDGTAETVSGIEAVDDQTVRIRLAAPNAEFLRELVEPQNAIMPRHILESETAATIRQSEFVTSEPIGTGPYMLTDFRSDQYVELTAYEDYFKGAPQIGSIFYMLYGADAALAQLETGELDLAWILDPRETDRLEALDHLTIDAVPSTGIVRMELKNEAPPFDDVRVRQAAYYAIDRHAICEEILEGMCTLLHVNPGFMKYEGLNEYEHDLGMAQSLLDEAGYDGQPVRLMWDSGIELYNTVFPIVGQYMEDAGFTVELQPTETSVFVDRLRFERDTWEIYVNTGGTELVSPDRTAVYFDCAYEGERGAWQTGYENCEMDEMFREARQVSDPAQRDDIYQQIAEILNEDVPAIHLWAPMNLFAYNSSLGGGFSMAPVDVESFTDVHTWTVGNG